jgi:hypothetical protein
MNQFEVFVGDDLNLMMRSKETGETVRLPIKVGEGMRGMSNEINEIEGKRIFALWLDSQREKTCQGVSAIKVK